jgi:hypothetical protein
VVSLFFSSFMLSYAPSTPIAFSSSELSCTEVDWRRQCATNVQVIMPEVQETVDSTDPAASASVAAADASSLAEKAISTLPPELAAHVVDPKRKARSQDPGWKYGQRPDPTNKDFVQCIFCMKVVPAGIKRFKQHLAGGCTYTMKCIKVPELISKEMHAHLKNNSKFVINLDGEEGE